MKSRITRLGSLAGAIAMIIILPGCSSNSATNNPPTPPAYTPKPFSSTTAAQMDGYKKMASMSPEQKAQYMQQHPDLANFPPMPPRRD